MTPNEGDDLPLNLISRRTTVLIVARCVREHRPVKKCKKHDNSVSSLNSRSIWEFTIINMNFKAAVGVTGT